MKRILTLMFASAMLGAIETSAQTPYNMSSGNYMEDFSTISTWSNNYGATSNWKPVSGTTVFSSTTSGGVQKGTENMVFLATGTNTTQTDLLLDFSNRNAGTISLDWEKVNNGTTTRYSALSLQYSTDGVSFSPLGTDTALVLNSSTPQSGSFSIALPAALSNTAGAVIRFYVTVPSALSSTGSGNRPKISIDNLSITSTAMVACSAAPIFTAQPTDQIANEGQTVTFTSTANGANSYQWQVNEGAGWNNIVGATAASYTTSATTLAMSGFEYRVNASCDLYNTTSDEVTLTVNCNPASITTQPSDVSAVENTNATFNVVATGSEPLTYQWQVNTGSGFSNITGATANSYTESNVTLAMSGYTYKVIVNNGCGAPAESNTATLTVTTAPIVATYTAISALPSVGSTANVVIGVDNSTNPDILMKSIQGANTYFDTTRVVIDGITVSTGVAPENVFVMNVIEADKISLYQAGKGYVSYSGSGNSGAYSSTLDSSAIWSVTYNSTNGVWTLTNRQYQTRVLQYNSGSPRFAAYTTNQVKVGIYLDQTTLPVHLKQFVANKNGKSVELTWTTASETNNKGFELERSADGKIWTAIATLASNADQGNSHTALNYSFVDTKPMAAKNLYRLKQYDFDGRFEYSPIRTVIFDNNNGVYTIYPNPANNSIQIDGLTGVETIKFVNALGKIVKTANAAQANISVADLAVGVYQLQIVSNNNTISTQRLVITQ